MKEKFPVKYVHTRPFVLLNACVVVYLSTHCNTLRVIDSTVTDWPTMLTDTNISDNSIKGGNTTVCTFSRSFWSFSTFPITTPVTQKKTLFFICFENHPSTNCKLPRLSSTALKSKCVLWFYSGWLLTQTSTLCLSNVPSLSRFDPVERECTGGGHRHALPVRCVIRLNVAAGTLTLRSPFGVHQSEGGAALLIIHA